MHAHAFDLLSLSSTGDMGRAGAGAGQSYANGNSGQVKEETHTLVPSSVPAGPSILSASRPVMPKARRMSSSTTGVLGRGKLGLTGEKE